jgi:OmcA/MtrC family decaheme c-type cytochrome
MTSGKPSPLRALILISLVFLLGAGLTACGEKGDTGPQGPEGPPGPPSDVTDTGTSLETCTGCHGQNGVAPVGDIEDSDYVHFIDADSDGVLTESGLRKLMITVTQVDVTGSTVVIDFEVASESGSYDLIEAGDGRFTIAKLIDPTDADPANDYDPNYWQSLIETTEDPGGVGDGPGTPEQQATYESFTTNSSGFQNLGGGQYQYTSSFDPSGGSYPVAGGDTMRVAIQISGDRIPSANGWCDFDADAGLSNPNDCTSPVSRTRDIVQTATCNTCHGATDDTKLAVHGGGRTDVEYCVTCHNPGTTDANSGNTVNLTQMIHKIHAGATLANGYKIWGYRNSLHDYSEVNFTKDLGDCQVCHTGGGADVENWHTQPTIEACGSCHDDIDFATNGGGHPLAPVTNPFCADCHNDANPDRSILTRHLGTARKAEADLYAGGGNGYVILPIDPATDFDSGSGDLTISFSVVRDGVAMDLAADPEWTAPNGASRLAILAGWNTDEYSNEDSGNAPAGPISVNALDIGGAVTDNLDGTYTTVVNLPGAASDTVTVAMEGHPAADLNPYQIPNVYETRLSVKNAFAYVNVGGPRNTPAMRRDVVDVAKCNGCHDSAGQGISLHGNNRTGEIQVCVMCHNPDATDINRRPADPADALDGKAEETIDFKRMIHQIHMGSELEEGVVIYGFGNTAHDFSGIDFIGNMQNCETCHFPGTYGTEEAWNTFATTIDTGDDLADPSDDLNISSTASVCSSCHDMDYSKSHMLNNGASFEALDEDIH